MGDEQEATSTVSCEGGTERKHIMTKAYFCQPLDKSSHRDAVHSSVKKLILEDATEDSAVPEVPIFHLGQCGWEAVGQVLSPTYFAMTLCRKFNLLPSERCSLLSLRDQYQAIQLCLAKINKKKYGDFMAAVSDVLDVWNELYRDSITASNELLTKDEDCDDLNLPSSRRESYDPVVREMQEVVTEYQEFLQSSGCIDHFTVYSLLRNHLQKNPEIVEYICSKVYVIEGVSHFPTMERELLKLLLKNVQSFKLSIVVPLMEGSSSNDLDMSGIGETSLNTSQSMDDPKWQETSEMDEGGHESASDLMPSIEAEDLESSLNDYIEGVPKSPSMTDFSESELYLEQLVVAHLRLLINTRDELALAALCSMPGREITQHGFHDIKAEAQKKNMPMYQTILSFIMRLRLGGKGYQADVNSPILLHSKPLGEFVDSIMKLQNIVEEEPNPRKSAIKVLSLIKSGLMRLRGRVMKGSCIEKVCDCLTASFMRLTSEVSEESEVISKAQQTTAALRPCLKLLVQLCDEASGRIAEEIVDVLGDNFLTQYSGSKKTTTPIRIPTVLSLFRSPVDGSPASKLDKLDDDIDASLRVRLMKNKGMTPTNIAPPRFKSGCSWAPDDLSPVHKSDAIHDKTLSPIVGPTLRAMGNTKKSSHNWKEIVDCVAKEEEKKSLESWSSAVKQNNSKKSKEMEKRSKRSLLSDISNIASNSVNKKSKPDSDLANKKFKSSDGSKKSPTKKKSKTKPILKGQKSITSFFKV